MSYPTNSSTDEATRANTLPIVNQWYHVVITRDASFLKLYVNGTIIDSTATNGSIPQYGSNPIFYIGTRFNSTMFFDGCLDDFRMYNRAVNSTEVKALFNEGKPSCGLVGYYPFTGNANDSSGNAQNGTVYGATLTTDRFGNANSAYSFDGSTSYISVPPFNYLNNNYSYSYWLKSAVNPITNGNYTFSIGTLNQAAAEGAASGVNSTLGISGLCYANNSSIDEATRANTLPIVNQWYHVVITRDASFLKNCM